MMAEKEIIYEENIENVEVVDTENPTIVVSEVVGTFADTNDMTIHNNLHDRDALEAHPISAIKGLSEKLEALDTAKTPKVLYSSEYGVANYYKWNGDMRCDDYGYFVSVITHENDEPNTIAICNKQDVFGVTVDGAAFIGGYDKDGRDNAYALVATLGLVDVRCESGVKPGDYVVSSDRGMAQTTDSNYGYKVIAVNTRLGTDYATIVLGIPADQIKLIDENIEDLKEYKETSYRDIITAMTVAQQAYNKAQGAVDSSAATDSKTDGAIDYIDNKINEFDNEIKNINGIANDALDTAIEIKDEAVSMANAAWEEATKATKGVERLDGTAEYLLTSTKQTADEVTSLVTSIDKYSIGEYSQSYGLTVAQARAILRPDMVYIPMNNDDDDPDTHEEIYTFIDGEVEYVVKQPFTCGFYYKWEDITHTIPLEDGTSVDMSGYWWKGYRSEVWANPNSAPNIDCTYWYINGEVTNDELKDKIEPHSLYMYMDILDENGDPTGEKQWVKVNTLAGNVNNRTVSMIKQTSNEIKAEVSNTQKAVVAVDGRVDDHEAKLVNIASWQTETETNMATIESKADATGASVAQVASQICSEYITLEEDWDETDKDTSKVYYTKTDKKYWYFKDEEWLSTDYPTEAGLVVNSASIIAAINKDGSGIKIDADHVVIDGAQIDLTADQITAIADQVEIKGEDVILKGQTIKISADDAFEIEFEHFSVNTDGKIEATGGEIGGWSISEDYISKDSVCLMSSDDIAFKSLVTDNGTSPVRMGAGCSGLSFGEFTVNGASTVDMEAIDGYFYFTHQADKEVVSAQLIDYGCSEPSYEEEMFGGAIVTVDDNTITVAIPCLDDFDLDPVSFGFTVKYSCGSNSDFKFAVLEDGSVYANAADISGTIHASEGEIGGWKINGNGIVATNNKAGMLSSGSSVRFFAGAPFSTSENLTITETVNILPLNTEHDALNDRWTFDYTPQFITNGEPGAVYQIHEVAQIGTSTGCNVTDISIVADRQRIFIIMSGEPSINASIQVQFVYSQVAASYEFAVHEDGTLYANKAEITGKITATDGTLGDLLVNGTLTTGNMMFGIIPDMYNPDTKISGMILHPLENGPAFSTMITNSLIRTPYLYADIELSSQFGDFIGITTQEIKSALPDSDGEMTDIGLYFTSSIKETRSYTASASATYDRDDNNNVTATYFTVELNQLLLEDREFEVGYTDTSFFPFTYWSSSIVKIKAGEKSGTVKHSKAEEAGYVKFVENNSWTYEFEQTSAGNQYIGVTGNLIPEWSAQLDTDSFDLGSQDYPWNNIYANNVAVWDGSQFVTFANLIDRIKILEEK